jgi:hypothetical protein
MVLTSKEDIARQIARAPDNTLLIGHGSIDDPQFVPGQDFVWGTLGTPNEYLSPDPADSRRRLSLKDLPGVQGRNLFGCYLSPRVRKVRERRASLASIWGRTVIISASETYVQMFTAFYERLSQYASQLPKEAPAQPVEVVIYEGERGQGERDVPTEQALRHPLLDEEKYPTTYYQTSKGE